VAVVTGGGGGIGGAIAEELGRAGVHVVTVDPLVTLEGTERLPEPEETTAGRIVAAGGSAEASSASVTDREAVARIFQELADRYGGVDIVVNVAGITRQTGFAHGEEGDWRDTVDVHLGGYLNVLGAALPLMAATGRGRIVGVTSGSGWRAANAGGYSSAKRVVASLTWQLGRTAPPGVTVNAISPIAATRMVAAAAERARRAGRTGDGGLNLFESMPGPGDLAPFAAYLVSDEFSWCNGQVLFVGGSEVAVVDEPRLMEVVRTEGATSLAGVFDTVLPKAFARSEGKQLSDGGGNPRFGPLFSEEAPVQPAPSDVQRAAVACDTPDLGAALTAALGQRGVTCHPLPPATGFGEAADALRSLDGRGGPIDALVVAPAGRVAERGSSDGWVRTLAEHRGIEDGLHADAAWARAASDYSAGTGRPLRLVTLTDGSTAGGRSRGQAAAQQARVGAASTEGRVTAFSATLEGPPRTTVGPAAELVAHLVAHPDAGALAGAELVVGGGWVGLRSHPRPGGSVTFGGPDVPLWLDGVLRQIVGVDGRAATGGAR
jgi:NAD(P)-dependent dehydrogenase (short-subunit alcohol dehydrogenase family)